MSTIEKAAAKLAAKRKAKQAGTPEPAGSSVPDGPSANTPQPPPAPQAAQAPPPPQPELTPAARHSLKPISLGLDKAPDLANSAFGQTGALPGNDAPATRASSSGPVTFRIPAVPAGVAELDLEALEREGYIRPEGSGTAQAQEFRRIKRQLLNRIDRQRQLLATPQSARPAEHRSTRGVPPNLVMVTSALAGEGKTSVTINLAMSLAAEVDHTVLLVDGDIAKSDLTRQFNLMDRIGLGEVLKNPSMVSEALLGTNVPRLSVIPAGQYQENLDELFASDLMQSFAISLAEDNPDRIVVFDSAPLLVTTEAAVLAEHMSEILMVVEANRTPKEAVTQALSEFNDYERVSLILNKISGNSRFSQGYGYGYGYGYGKAQESGGTAEMDAVKTGTHS